MPHLISGFLSTALVMFAAGLAGPAGAAVMQATYTGTILDGSDMTGIFGAGSSLDGLSYEARFTYDPATPGANRFTDSGGDRASDWASGGSDLGIPSPIRSAQITINHQTHYFDVGHYDFLESSHNVGYSTTSQFVSSVVSDAAGIQNDGLSSYAYAALFDLPARLDETVSLKRLGAFPDMPNGGGSFAIQQCAFQGSRCVASINTVADLNAATVRISAVPVPGTLSLMAFGLLGLGLVGLRRPRGGSAAA